MTETGDETSEKLIDAALEHVPFDGWSEATFKAAIADAGVDETVARSRFPRGALDLALGFHARGDAEMEKRYGAAAKDDLRFRDKIALAVRLRLEAVEDQKEAVRRGSTLLALPQYAPDGAKAIWGTADAVWNAVGDTSEDYNWYTKRATLSGVYGATVLYWLGDDSPGHQATWAFLDRRIDDVMQIEKVKAGVRKNPVFGPLMTASEKAFSWVRPPARMPRTDLPGRWSGGGAG